MKTVEFKEKDHTYWLKNTDTGHSNRLPGVTGVIDFFANTFAGIPRGVLEKAADRGRAVHLATEYYDQGNLDEEKLDPILQPFLKAWKHFKEKYEVDICETERRVWHPRYLYAGQLDRIIRVRGRKFLLDIKTGAAMRPTTGPQTAAYMNAYAQDGGVPLPRMGVELHKDSTYTVKELEDPNDFPVFLAALTLYRWRLKNAK